MQKRLNEILERKEAIKAELANADEKRVAELSEEVDALNAEEKELRSKMTVAGKIVGQEDKPEERGTKMNKREERANALKETGRMSMEVEETRSLLVSGGTVATPTEVSGINDMVGGGNVSVLDMVYVENCEGMGTHRVAYLAAEADAAGDQTEGSAVASKEGTFAYKDITPTSIGCYAQISKQAKKQSPLQYEAKVSALALKSLKKKAVALIASKLKGSALVQALTAPLDASSKGLVDEKTLRNIAFAYGGNDEIDGGAVLFLNKADLTALGDVRGSHDKKPVYEITPDGANPNTGIIKDGGLSVRYCLMSGLTALAGTAQGAAAQPTMFYGNPKNFELDLFSNYEIKVSEDFAFTSLMDTIVGDAEIGGDVVVKNGFVTLQIAATT